jgi:DNA (cytosine-5)-methyltransferase 1
MLTARPITIDLFAGAGGFGLGFEMAGFSVPLSVEIDAWACDTLRYNRPKMTVIQQDIRDLNTASSIKDICHFKPDIVIGGPPCQGFSIAGRVSASQTLLTQYFCGSPKAQISSKLLH